MPDDLRACPVCWARFTPNGRQIYCTDRCRKTAYQRRQRHTADHTRARARVDAARPPVDERACPHCGYPITVITLLTTPHAARPRLRAAPVAGPLITPPAPLP